MSDSDLVYVRATGFGAGLRPGQSGWVTRAELADYSNKLVPLDADPFAVEPPVVEPPAEPAVEPPAVEDLTAVPDPADELPLDASPPERKRRDG